MSQKLNFAGYSVEMGECADDSRIRLSLSGDLPKLLNASIPAAQAVHDQLEREVAEALAVQTPASRELARCQAEAERIEGELAAVAQREQSAPLELDRAVEAGDLSSAEKLQSEIAQLPLRKKIATKARRYAVENMADARAALDTEHAGITQRIRARRVADLTPAVAKAEQRLAKAIAEHLPALLEAEKMLSATREGWTPTGRGYHLSAAERGALEERRADEARALEEAARKRQEIGDPEEMRRAWRENAAGATAMGRFWSAALGWNR